MRITRVEALPVLLPATDPPYRWRRGLPGSGPDTTGAVLAIGTDDGLVGYAFDPHGDIVMDVTKRVIEAELLGADPLQREWLWHRIWEIDRLEELPIYALGLVDVALWDLAAKSAGLPLYRLLGGFRTSIPAYASTSTFESTAEYLDVVDQCQDLGYTAIKIHGWGNAREDAALALALRDHVGPTVPLMYDGSAGFDLADAIYLGNALTEADYLWYEEPMREFSISAYRRLSERVRIPLLVAETSDGAHFNTADFISSGCATSVRTSARYKAGITGAMRIAHLADAHLLRAEVHGSGLPSVHLCMAIANTTFYESLVTSNPVVRERLVDSTGMVHAPTEPGIGLESAIRIQVETTG